MRYIDMKTWSRREHYKLYSALDFPYFGMCANVDLTEFHPVVKRLGISFTVATAYVLARAANAIPEFRYRIRQGKVVEHETAHPSITILTDENLFSFCTIEYTERFSLFSATATKRIAHVKEHPTLEDEPGQDDLLYLSSIPWVSFTSCMHPVHLHPPDSVPRFVWGKIFKDGGRMKMPLGVQTNHALMDGIHVGRFYEEVQGHLRHPGSFLDKA